MAFINTAWLAARGWRNRKGPATPVEVGTDEPGNAWPEVTGDALDRIHEAGIEHMLEQHGRRIAKVAK